VQKERTTAFGERPAMTTKLIFAGALFAVLMSCGHVGENKPSSGTDSIAEIHAGNGSEKIVFGCDSIYMDKGISLKFVALDSNEEEPEYRFVFLVAKQQRDQETEIFRDTIESTTQSVKFTDFNNDNVKDILVQNSSDVRSNWTYHLYLADKNVESVRKIKGYVRAELDQLLQDRGRYDQGLQYGDIRRRR
jgi:hypothetical protein